MTIISTRHYEKLSSNTGSQSKGNITVSKWLIIEVCDNVVLDIKVRADEQSAIDTAVALADIRGCKNLEYAREALGEEYLLDVDSSTINIYVIVIPRRIP